MADLYAYKGNFDPILLPGETARLVTSSERMDIECVAVGALPEHYKDFGALVAVTWDRENTDTDLEMNDNELAQYRMRILDDVKMEFNNLGPTKQWRTARANFYLRQYPQNEGEDFLKEFMFKASEFFVYEDDTPRFDFYSDIALTTCRVLFSGWRLAIKKVQGLPKQSKTILVSGWVSGGSL